VKAKILFSGKAIPPSAGYETEFLKKSHGRRTSFCPRAKRAQSRKNTGRPYRPPLKIAFKNRKVCSWCKFTTALELFSKIQPDLRPASALKSAAADFSSKTEKFSLHFLMSRAQIFFQKRKRKFFLVLDFCEAKRRKRSYGRYF
jgi:hypothetical protein